jgi:ethanolamine utilization microcompartment shell protein EutS
MFADLHRWMSHKRPFTGALILMGLVVAVAYAFAQLMLELNEYLSAY